MKAIQLLNLGVALAWIVLSPGTNQASGTNTNTIIGQWEFDEADLRAAVGQAMEYFGTTTTNDTKFLELTINGATAKVMEFPAATPEQGYVVKHDAAANGGGTKLNQYSLIMDLMFPADFIGYHALLQTGTNDISDDAELFVNVLNQLGTGGEYYGNLEPGTWNRVAVTVDVPNDTMTTYINGALVHTHDLNTSIDGNWALGSSFLLFADNNNDTGPGYVNSIQFRTGIMSTNEVFDLGGASAGGIGTTNAVEFRMSITKTGNSIQIAADTPGTYQLQTKPTLSTPTWSNEGVPGPGPWQVTNSGTGIAFYRLQKM